MARIKGKGNKTTEEKMAAEFRREGIGGWRRHAKLPGRPDFTFPREKLCVFVHGCFWHGCPKCYRAPATNTDFWNKKVLTNRRRDRRVARMLRAKGYKVLTVWECQLKAKVRPRSLKRIARALAHRRH